MGISNGGEIITSVGSTTALARRHQGPKEYGVAVSSDRGG